MLKIWGNLSINPEVNLNDFSKRTNAINNIVSIAYTYKINGINISFNEENKGIERMIIELAPRLREMGISTNIVLNSSIDENKYKEIVDYIITNE